MPDGASGKRAGPIEEPDASEALSSEARIHELLTRELGAEMADAFARTRALQERWARRQHPDEGLRERKKRLTRQRISDVATALFVVRGFEHVTVSEIAQIVGVSEKTVFNYFPTKEALVFDRADDGIERMTAALRERERGESPTKAMLRALSEDPEEFEELPDEIHMFMPLFSEMVASTPSLRGAWLDLQGRLVEAATQELAARADVDPRDPEPMIAARAIIGLQEVGYSSRIRHIEDGLRGSELREAVMDDLERAARLLDTGLWSFGLLTQGARSGAQLRDAAAAADDARRQVVEALKQARSTWQEIRRGNAAGLMRDRVELELNAAEIKRGSAEIKRTAAEIKRSAKQLSATERKEAKRTASRAGQSARMPARKGKLSRREAHALAERSAYEAYRRMLGERHEAIRERESGSRGQPDS